MMDEGTAGCSICDHRGPIYNRFGQRMFRKWNGTWLCINHYSQAEWPETYVEIVPEVEELIGEHTDD